MQRYSKTSKTCATCMFWSGKREIERMGEQVLIPVTNASGKCQAPSGGCRGREKTCGSVCSSWKKLSILK